MHTRQLTLDIAPWRLFRALARKERSFLIDAALPWGDEWISSMGFRPRMQFRVPVAGGSAGAALASLDAVLAEIAPPARARARPRPVPFAGGTVVALAYEVKNEIERLPQAQVEATDAPHLVGAVYDAVVAYDHRRRRYVVASWHLDEAALDRYADEVRAAAAEVPAAASPPPRAGAPVTCNLDRDGYTTRVERVREYIAAGDVYQVNLSMRFRAPLSRPPLDLYGSLRAVQPVPFGGYFDLGREQVLSNSPELFLRRRGERVITCPIKGTRPRGAAPARDAALVAELVRDPKERAEHVMIVDLERNDLGRVCASGSVAVEHLAAPVTFATLHHLVSTVRGRLRDGVGTTDLVRATFPSGSITGAPKIRAMEIIDEVERGPRGFYTGALGWIDAGGDLDLNVAIRTATARDGDLVYHAGSGVVADSRAEAEHAECLLKAAAFFRALGLGTAAPREHAPAEAGRRLA